jgi:hypothetical protein
VTPSAKDMCTAIMGVWLDLRIHVKARDFSARLQTHRKECIVRDWTNLALVWERYERDARQAWKHFKAHPEVYGASTPEMIDRFKSVEREHGKAVRKWRAYVDWVWANDLPPDVVAYDPTGHGSEYDADDPDRWAAVRGADLAERWRERNVAHARVRAHKSDRRSRKPL